MKKSRKSKRSKRRSSRKIRKRGGTNNKIVHCIVDSSNYLHGYKRHNENFTLDDLIKTLQNIINLFIDINNSEYKIHLTLVSAHRSLPSNSTNHLLIMSNYLINYFKNNSNLIIDGKEYNNILLHYEPCNTKWGSNEEKNCDLKVALQLLIRSLFKTENLDRIILISGDQDYKDVFHEIKLRNSKLFKDKKFNIVAFDSSLSPTYLKSTYHFTKIDENPNLILTWDRNKFEFIETSENNKEAVSALQQEFPFTIPYNFLYSRRPPSSRAN